MTRILIVEDEPLIRRSLRKLLERNGYEVSEAQTVPEAKAEIASTEFSIIISDLRLPEGLGSELIRLPGHDIPVIIITSYANLRSAVEIMRMGAVDYIAKPFDHNEIIKAVTRVVTTLKREEQQVKPSQESEQKSLPTAGSTLRDSSLESYFVCYVLENEGMMSETQLAHNLGISRKSLWEKRQKLNIPRRRNPS